MFCLISLFWFCLFGFVCLVIGFLVCLVHLFGWLLFITFCLTIFAGIMRQYKKHAKHVT